MPTASVPPAMRKRHRYWRTALEGAAEAVKYLLDTNAVSALMRGAPAILDRLRCVARADVALPPPVVAEIACGLARLPKSTRRQELADRFELVRQELGRSEWTDSVSDRFGAIKATLERKGERSV